MKKNYCDKCGKEIEVDIHTQKNCVMHYFYDKTGNCNIYYYEYCKECYKKVEKYSKTWHGEK